jgi:hypothetical protein
MPAKTLKNLKIKKIFIKYKKKMLNTIFYILSKANETSLLQ